MPKSTSTPHAQHSPRADAVTNAAAACNAHQQHPDTYTLHRMQAAVQTAQLLGASLQDIRAARGQQ
ncbi:hypothetical protein AB0C88_37715 [Streptomyces chartreusis]|uniref:hypothetical protein n=1 Tax=Streptomyces chartreusis TaxID=1969 RepID=UPI0033F7FE28